MKAFAVLTLIDEMDEVLLNKLISSNQFIHLSAVNLQLQEEIIEVILNKYFCDPFIVSKISQRIIHLNYLCVVDIATIFHDHDEILQKIGWLDKSRGILLIDRYDLLKTCLFGYI